MTRDRQPVLRDDTTGAELTVDLLAGDLGRRLATRSIRDQPLARAVGLPGRRPRVLDCTAGLLGDALLLVGLGCQVTALERAPLLAALLRAALAQAQAAPGPLAAALRTRLTLQCGDARDFLRTLGHDACDVIYLDPMFPDTGKSALPRKEIQLLRTLVGADGDAAELLDLALAVGVPRVVVKRPRQAPPLRPGRAHAFAGKLQRFDLYLPGTARP